MKYTKEDLQSKPTKKLIRLAMFSGMSKASAICLSRDALITYIIANPPKDLED